MQLTAASVFLLITVLQLTSAADDKVPPNCLGKTFNVDPFYCCKTPKLLDEAVVKQCMQLYPPPKDSQTDIKPDCISECMMNRTGIFNRKKSINDEKAMNTFTDKLDENSLWVSVVEDSVKDCLAQADARKSDFDKDMKELQKRFGSEKICSPAAGFIVECVHAAVYRNCPAKIFKSSDSECNAIKTHLSQCPFFTIFPNKPTKTN
ncbi:uncharacterized protein LOC131690642 [Topomyia yanbarensis]|uniref:uncharacterized protein LOC131690642 n=1 Tax=Topomyia yanbarensis TaxID=2498891 RepID=UPI00273B4BF1|nr:uncharacterized protein LOC131690642 [Topomyia yanbarensis]